MIRIIPRMRVLPDSNIMSSVKSRKDWGNLKPERFRMSLRPLLIVMVQRIQGVQIATAERNHQSSWVHGFLKKYIRKV